MESAVSYVINTTVAKIEQKRMAVRAVKTGRTLPDGKAETEIEYEDMGWFVQFDGMRESWRLSAEKPELAIGQQVEIIIKPKESAP
jgi:hypothetical protein